MSFSIFDPCGTRVASSATEPTNLAPGHWTVRYTSDGTPEGCAELVDPAPTREWRDEYHSLRVAC